MNTYHNFTTVREIHAEITSHCNAACPMCARNNLGGKVLEDLELSSWSAEDAYRVFDSRFHNLRNVLFCGTHGDPAANPQAPLIIEKLKQIHPKCTVEFYSNGSIRNPNWWSQLAQRMQTRGDSDHYRTTDIGIFSIDGLGDTNHIYRRNTSFDKIIANAEAFIQAGGIARWDYLVFKHNEHQIEEAQELSKKLGFKHFRLRKTSRFRYSPDGPNRFTVLKNDGTHDYYLYPPKFVENINAATHAPTDKKISCLYRDEFKRLYVDFKTRVHACCFLSAALLSNSGKVFTDTVKHAVDPYPNNFNSLRHNDWESIFNENWFRNDLVDSWKNLEQSPLQCQRTCAHKVSPITSQSLDKT